MPIMIDGAHPNSSDANVFSSIDKFKSIVSEKGLHDPSRYVVFVSSPKGQMASDNAYYCKGLNVKGASFQTTNRFTHGPERDIPYLETYGNGTSLTFYNDYEFTEYLYFFEWMQDIGGKTDWYMQWYKQFIGNIFIMSFDEENNPRLGISLAEVYPTSISDISMSYDSKGKEISTFVVNLAFHHYELKHWPANYESSEKVGSVNNIVGDPLDPDSGLVRETGDLIATEMWNPNTMQFEKMVERGNMSYSPLTAEQIKDEVAGEWERLGVPTWLGWVANSWGGDAIGLDKFANWLALRNRAKINNPRHQGR